MGYDAAYSCGLILNLSLDAALRRISPERDGLYALWRRFVAASAAQEPSESLYLASIAEIGTAELAEAVRRIVRATNPDFAELDVPRTGLPAR